MSTALSKTGDMDVILTGAGHTPNKARSTADLAENQKFAAIFLTGIPVANANIFSGFNSRSVSQSWQSHLSQGNIRICDPSICNAVYAAAWLREARLRSCSLR